MEKNKKNDDTDKRVVERVNKALEKFHEYLGAPFEMLVPSDKGNNLYELYIKDTWHLIKIEEDIDNIYIPIDLAGNTTAYSSLILFSCIKNIIENEDEDKRAKIDTEFWFAGLPFNFQVEGFVKKYLGQTSAIRLKEILHLIGIKEKTYGPYFSYRKGKFNDADLPELIEDIFNRGDKDTLTVFNVKKDLGISKYDLIEYIQLVSEQFILTDNDTKIFFQKPTE